jgi:CheY-like chemotaxis protein
MVTVIDREIDRIAVVDDDPEARRAYRLTVEDANLLPVEIVDSITSLDNGFTIVRDRAQAVLCDHNLRKRNYATFNGAEFVARCNASGLPAVLCTQYERPDVEQIRRFRARIPVLLRSDELEPEQLIDGLGRCVSELANGPDETRRLWRAQVRVVDEGEGMQKVFFVVIPAWGSSERIGVGWDDVPLTIREAVAEGRRFHAEVNLGAESSEEIYFGKWETE